MITPPSDWNLDQWIDDFISWSVIIVIFSGVMSLLWYTFGEWIFKIREPKDSNKRPIWMSFFIIPIILIIVAFIITPQAGGSWFAYISYAFDGILCYYIATALFSPESVKYIPLLAQQFWRRLW
jgi:hypothetical protein